jgi:hypothetical protein
MKKWSYTRLENVDSIKYLVIKHKIYKLVRSSEAKTQILNIMKEDIKENYKNLKWDIYFKLQKFNTVEEAEFKMNLSNGTIYDDSMYDEMGRYIVFRRYPDEKIHTIIC